MTSDQPRACICPQFTDTGAYGIADLTCPVHGVDGTNPGDGFPLPAARVDADTPKQGSGDELRERLVAVVLPFVDDLLGRGEDWKNVKFAAPIVDAVLREMRDHV